MRFIIMATVVIALLFGACLPATTWGSQIVELKVGFAPNKLGASTTIHLDFAITTTTGALPPPMTDVDIALPAGMGLGTTDLGEATCDPLALLEFGSSACSPNSRMGFGHATVQLPLGPEPVSDFSNITVFMGPPVEHRTTMLIYADSESPVSAQFVFRSQLLPGSAPFGAHLNTVLPLIPTVPGGSDAAVVHMQTTLGPSHLTYYTHVHGRVVSYKPTGMAVPEHCPRGGFPFEATYLFQDGSTTSVGTVVPCPQSSHNHNRVHGAS